MRFAKRGYTKCGEGEKPEHSCCCSYCCCSCCHCSCSRCTHCCYYTLNSTNNYCSHATELQLSLWHLSSISYTYAAITLCRVCHPFNLNLLPLRYFFFRDSSIVRVIAYLLSLFLRVQLITLSLPFSCSPLSSCPASEPLR